MGKFAKLAKGLEVAASFIIVFMAVISLCRWFQKQRAKNGR